MDIQDLRKQINEEIFDRINPALPIWDEKENRLEQFSNIILANRTQLQPLYRYVPADVYNVLSLLNENVYLVSADKLNDDYEGFIRNHGEECKPFTEKLEQFQKQTILKSFSERENSPKMWENYAEHHTGMRITYHFDELPQCILEHFYPVQYEKEFFSCVHPDTLRNSEYFYLRKETKWKDEREWRFVYLTDNEHTISLENCITEVCFGLRMDKNLRHSIVEAVKKAYPNRKIAFRQATTGSRKLKIQELK